MGIISSARFAHNAVGLISRARYRVPKTVLASVGLVPVSLGRCLVLAGRAHTGQWTVAVRPLHFGRTAPIPGWNRSVEEEPGARAPGPRPPCELAGLGVGERESADDDASNAHPVSPLQFRAPASSGSGSGIGSSAVQCGSGQDRTQEADAPFPAVNPCGGACLTLAPSPPPISPSLPRLPSGRSLSPVRRVLSRILYSGKELGGREALFSPPNFLRRKKTQRAHPLRFQSPPKPGYRTLADENSQKRPLTSRRFQFSVSRSQACGRCSLS